MYLNKFIFGNAVGKLNSRLDNVEIEIQIQRNWDAEQKEIMKERGVGGLADFSWSLVGCGFGDGYGLNVCVPHPNLCSCVHAQSLRRVWLFVVTWIIAYQAPLSTGFSRREHWSGLPVPSPGDLPDPGINCASPVPPTMQENSLQLSHPGKPL